MSKASSVVLVTGANGFIACAIVDAFLRAGYTVRGTIRSDTKAGQWKKTFEQYSSQLQTAIVPDITAAGAFDEAVKGVDYVIHAASPLVKLDGSARPKEDTVDPAINGTTTILKSAIREPRIKKVVILSSVAATVDYSKPFDGSVSDGTTWCPFTYEFSISSNPINAYRGSKALAEKSAWEFYKNEKPHFKLSAINPAFVFGPSLGTQEPFTGGTNDFVATVLFKPETDLKKALGGPYFVDVRDVADAHVLAVENDAADGKRFILAAEPAYPTDYVRILSKSGILPPGHQLPKLPEDDFQYPPNYVVNVEASKKTLGLKYRSREETLIDTAKWLLKVAGK